MTSARDLATALGARPSGAGWLARCPAHNDANPSLWIVERDDTLLVHCRSKCTQGDVIGALRRRGLWGRSARPVGAPTEPQDAQDAAPSSKPARDPLKSWRAALPVFPGSLVDVYLRGRGIELYQDEAAALCFAPSLYHWPSGSRLPAMLAPVKTADGRVVTVHQTFLSIDGRSKAPVERPRLFPAGASPTGPGVWFGAIDPNRELVICEGIESTLSAMRLLAASAGVAALSARGIRELILPEAAHRIVIFADRDPKEQGLDAARSAWLRWRTEGRDVRVILPDRDGEDANDILLRRLAHG